MDKDGYSGKTVDGSMGSRMKSRLAVGASEDAVRTTSKGHGGSNGTGNLNFDYDCTLNACAATD